MYRIEYGIRCGERHISVWSDERSLTLPTVYGALGEIYAIDSLSNNGFKVCRADEIDAVGHSLLTDNSDTPFDNNPFDCSKEILYELATLCRKCLVCEVDGPKPCVEKSSEFYDFNPEPKHQSVVYTPDTGNEKFRGHCARKLSYLAILDISNHVFAGNDCFLRTYLQIDNYIQSFELPPAVDFAAGHPGRIDLFAQKDNKYFCLEVKVNTSTLLKWQAMRLNWMKRHGYEAGILRVTFTVQDKKELFKLFRQEKFDDAITLINPQWNIEPFDVSKTMVDYIGEKAYFANPYRDEFPTEGVVKEVNKMRARLGKYDEWRQMRAKGLKTGAATFGGEFGYIEALKTVDKLDYSEDEIHYTVDIKSFNQECKIRGEYLEVTILGWERNKEIKCTCPSKNEICLYKKKKIQIKPSPKTFECSILKVKVENISSQLVGVNFCDHHSQMIDTQGNTHEPTSFCDDLYPRGWKHPYSDLYDGTQANFYLILPELEEGVDIKRFIYKQDIDGREPETFDFRLKST